jgi:hypothetical protein
MVYVVMMDQNCLGRGDIIGVFHELDNAIKNVRNVYENDISICIYKLNMDNLYIDINDIFHCVWKNF